MFCSVSCYVYACFTHCHISSKEGHCHFSSKDGIYCQCCLSSSDRHICYLQNKRAHGPWNAHLIPCQEERMFTTKYKSHSPTLKSILGITQIITKAYQVTKFKQIILICTIQCLTFLPNPKD